MEAMLVPIWCKVAIVWLVCINLLMLIGHKFLLLATLFSWETPLVMVQPSVFQDVNQNVVK